MKWHEVKIHTSNEAKEAIANIFNENGANGVVIEDSADLNRENRSVFGEIFELNPASYPKEGVIIKAYFADDENWSSTMEHLKQKIIGLRTHGIHLGANQLTINQVKESDWENEWKQYFKAEKVTDRFVIVPSWESYTQTDEQELIINIDPGMAFGTGTHPTTILSLMALEKMMHPSDIVLDVGSGSGVLSIGAVLLGASHVYSYDLDPIAVKSTTQNRDLNRLQDKITVYQNDLLHNTSQEADIIVSNILAHILVELVDDASAQLKQHGIFITSGIIESKEGLIRDKIETSGFRIIDRFIMDKWVALIAQKE